MNLTFTICMFIAGAYTNCTTNTVPRHSETIIQCMITAQPFIADWMDKHYLADMRNHVVRSWSCVGI